ncbi:MAG: hypothetical protein QNK37_31350 [Acidobacteriota bacterium]|nr:hypothetical protein [Acidobacteriota bacterium]
MADHNALRDAQRLYDKALSLSNEIDSEVSAMEASIRTGQAALGRAERVIADMGNHVGELGEQLALTSELEQGIWEHQNTWGSTGLIEVERGLLATQLPVVAGGTYLQDPSFPDTEPLDREALASSPALSMTPVWDAMATREWIMEDLLDRARENLEKAREEMKQKEETIRQTTRTRQRPLPESE